MYHRPQLQMVTLTDLKEHDPTAYLEAASSAIASAIANASKAPLAAEPPPRRRGRRRRPRRRRPSSASASSAARGLR